MIKISAIICTHNPRPDYFKRTLRALQAQTLPMQRWELLVIDNASKERLAQTWDLSWHPHARHAREEEVGLTPARLRGIKEARGDLLVFVDDDNLLADDFLETASTIAAEYSYLGAFGAGVLEPEFEVEPAPELIPQLWRLALRQTPVALWSSHTEDYASIPWGAGLCVKRRVAEAYTQLLGRLNVTMLLDRRGGHLFAGGDDAFSWAAVRLGQGFGIFPELRVTHLIPAGRLNQDYFLRLVCDHAFSHGVLGYRRAGIPVPRASLFQYVRLMLQGIRHGRFSMQCQWAALRGRNCAHRFISERHLKPVEQAPPCGHLDRQLR